MTKNCLFCESNCATKFFYRCALKHMRKLSSYHNSCSGLQMSWGQLLSNSQIPCLSSYIKANKGKIIFKNLPRKFLSQNPPIWAPLDSSEPKETKWDILSSLRTTWTLRTPRVTEGHFVFFVPNLYNMGVYGLPWTPPSKIWHFELTQDHLDTEDTVGVQRSLGSFIQIPTLWVSRGYLGPLFATFLWQNMTFW